MCCVGNSIKTALSDKAGDNYAEKYVPFEEDSLFAVGLTDFLFNDLFQLSDKSATQQGTEAFHLFLLKLPHFSVLLKMLLNLSFKSELD